jgi:hypothetical protein
MLQANESYVATVASFGLLTLASVDLRLTC